jgi:hypothetical protein
MSLWIKRFSLLAVLVLSQALYAGHAVSHISGDQADCQICLQASSGGAALVSTEFEPLLPFHGAPPAVSRFTPAAIVSFPNSHPTRAPPFFPV